MIKRCPVASSKANAIRSHMSSALSECVCAPSQGTVRFSFLPSVPSLFDGRVTGVLIGHCGGCWVSMMWRRDVYLLIEMLVELGGGCWTLEGTYDLARVFLLLRFRRRTRFFLHFALILTVVMVSM
jgi:hypothetical protein